MASIAALTTRVPITVAAANTRASGLLKRADDYRISAFVEKPRDPAIQAQFVSQGMVADIALHAKVGNPHAHILLTLRDIGPQGFGGRTTALPSGNSQ